MEDKYLEACSLIKSFEGLLRDTKKASKIRSSDTLDKIKCIVESDLACLYDLEAELRGPIIKNLGK